MKIKLNDTQIRALFDISRDIDELVARRIAMVDMAVAAAGEEPGPARIERLEDGIYIVSVEPEPAEDLPE
jgi:hypothetical protein